MNEYNKEYKARRHALEDICVRFGVSLLYSFGSQGSSVREWLDGERDALASAPSDVDIGVKALKEGHWSVHEKVRLAIELEDLLGCGRVDLVVLFEADPFLAAEIIRGERLYAHNIHAAHEYELFVLRRAGDLIPLERERMTLILGESQ